LLNEADSPTKPGKPRKKRISHRQVGRSLKQLGVKKNSQKKRKTGSRDLESPWCKASKAIIQQFLADLKSGYSALDGTLYVDEHTQTCVVGGGANGHHGQAGKINYTAPMKDGVYCPPKDGGEFAEPDLVIQPKFDANASGAFGVAGPTFVSKRKVKGRWVTERTRKGMKMKPVNYTSFIVVGNKKYHEHLETLFEEKRKMGRDSARKLAEYDPQALGPDGKKKRKPSKGVWHDYTDPSKNPFEEKYGASWREHIDKKFKYMNIVHIIDGVIAEGERIFKGSTREKDWKIYHDRLPTW
jgi:hypothetical protein